MKACVFLLFFLLAAAGDMDKASSAAQANHSKRMPLWNGAAPIGDGAKGKTADANAFITLHRPEVPNGTAIVIFPGGGYGGLVVGVEGHGIAAWLN